MTGVKEALDIEAEDIEMLIDLGHLLAFNIAVRDAYEPGDRLNPSNHRELRFLSSSVDHYRSTLGSRPIVVSMEAVMRQLIQHDKPLIDGTEVDSALNCHRHHRQRLIEAGELRLVDGTSWKPGPGGSPVITRESFVAFLERRRL